MAKTIPEIKRFRELLLPFIGANDTRTITYVPQLLNEPGENYGSLLLSLAVTLQETGSSAAETMHMIAKLCPPNDWLKRMFASHVTFKKEIGFYRRLVPTLVQFQQEHRVPEARLLAALVPECLSARISLDPAGASVDEDAVLLLEDLRLKGYRCQDRMTGFNRTEAELVVQDLARFHAVPLALRLQRPELFHGTVMPLLERIVIGQEMLEVAAHRFTAFMVRHLRLTAAELARFEDGMRRGFEFQARFPAGTDQYATMVHCDFWLNNTMLRYSGGQPVHNKMLDFQVAAYGSPATDLVFLLYTSVSLPVFDECYTHLIAVYHAAFVQCLQELHCDVSAYTLDSLHREIDRFGPLEASHILIMYKATFGDKTRAKEMDAIQLDDMFTDEGVTDVYKNRLRHAVQTFFDKGWF